MKFNFTFFIIGFLLLVLSGYIVNFIMRDSGSHIYKQSIRLTEDGLSSRELNRVYELFEQLNDANVQVIRHGDNNVEVLSNEMRTLFLTAFAKRNYITSNREDIVHYSFISSSLFKHSMHDSDMQKDFRDSPVKIFHIQFGSKFSVYLNSRYPSFVYIDFIDDDSYAHDLFSGTSDSLSFRVSPREHLIPYGSLVYAPNLYNFLNNL
jgi:hypothetical protein